MGRPPPASDRSRGCRRSRGTARSRRPRAGSRRPGSAQHAGLQAGEPLRDGQRHELRRADRHVVQLEGVEDRLDARVVAVGVVVGGADAEVAEPADELRDVRADELEHGLALLQRAAWSSSSPGWRRAGRPAACAWPRRGRCRRRGGARASRGRRPSAWRRARAGAAHAGTGRGPWSRAWSRRPAGPGRRASSAGSRTSSCRAAAWSAAARALRSARGSRPRSRPWWRSRCPRARDRSSRFSAIAVTVREEETMKSVSASSSCVASFTSRRALDSSGLKYSVASPACSPLPSSWVLKPAMMPCRSLRASGVERVEELVEVDGGRRVRGVDRRAGRAASGSRPGRARSRRSGSRCPTATSAGSPPRCPRAAARRAPRRGS